MWHILCQTYVTFQAKQRFSHVMLVAGDWKELSSCSGFTTVVAKPPQFPRTQFMDIRETTLYLLL